MKAQLTAITLFTLSLVPAFGGTPSRAAEQLSSDEKLVQMARDAQTPAEHATVARQYRLRAATLESKAKKHEAEASRLYRGPLVGLEGKWPGMVRKTWQSERALALQYRRAAQEALSAADHHIRLAVEGELAE